MATTAATAGVVAVVGVGVGIGGSVAKRFAKAGFKVALMGRDAGKLQEMANELNADRAGAAEGFVVDASSKESIVSAFANVKSRLGAVDVLVYNAGPQFQRAGILQIDPAVRVPARRARRARRTRS